MQGNHIRDEYITTPSSDHVKVEQTACDAPERGAVLHGLDPEVEGDHEQEDGNGFVVVRACYRTRNVSWRNTDKGRSEQTCRIVLHVGGEEVSYPGGQTGEGWCQHDTDIPNVDGDIDGVKSILKELRKRRDGEVKDEEEDKPKGWFS